MGEHIFDFRTMISKENVRYDVDRFDIRVPQEISLLFCLCGIGCARRSQRRWFDTYNVITLQHNLVDGKAAQLLLQRKLCQ